MGMIKINDGRVIWQFRRCGKSEKASGRSILWKITNFTLRYTTRKKRHGIDMRKNSKNALDNGCVFLCEKNFEKNIEKLLTIRQDGCIM